VWGCLRLYGQKGIFRLAPRGRSTLLICCVLVMRVV
jgi:hypothetical protein